MGAPKNMLRGFIFMAIYTVLTIVIPFLTFTYIRELTVSGLPIEITQEIYEAISFWVISFGLLISGCAFFTYSSPKQSIRKGVLALIQVLLNCLYLWSYKFSGATDIRMGITGYGHVILILQQMVLVYMGIYFLTIIIKIYDLVDFTVNREKIREKRWNK